VVDWQAIVTGGSLVVAGWSVWRQGRTATAALVSSEKAVRVAQERDDAIRAEEREFARSQATDEGQRGLLLDVDLALDEIDAAVMAACHAGEPSILEAIWPGLVRLRRSIIKLQVDPELRGQLDRVYELARLHEYIQHVLGGEIGAAGVVMSATDVGRRAIGAQLRGDPVPERNKAFEGLLGEANYHEWPTPGTSMPEFELGLHYDGAGRDGYPLLKPWRDAGSPRYQSGEPWPS
jgi:hypothetical protein